MVIQEEARSIPFQLEKSLKPRQKEQAIGTSLALGMAIALSAVLISSAQAAAFPSRLSQTALGNSLPLTSGIYPATETAQVSTDVDSSAWLYQGIVQLSYAGIIAWVIALLQNSGK